ncbi:MAG: hypothetical protein Q7R43_01405 [Candidatus Daviesbacteria bacterium]|nr:hypothetical protein [Candidatus Daviesbacteria bacterium]
MVPKSQISYLLLRKINPETARTAVLEFLKSNKGNVTKTAQVFGIQRSTVYNIIGRYPDDLKDKSKAPHKVANKTDYDIEQKILEASAQTGYGAKRLQKFLKEQYKIKIAYGTLRGILRR